MADLYGIKEASRQRKLADALRKRAESAAPEGQMVGGHFVAPSWTQHLNTLASMVGSGWAEGKAAEAEAASEGKLQEARQKWTSSIPQAVAAEYDTPKLEGLGGRERLAEPQVLKQAVPLTHQRVMQHYLAGAEIPGNEKIAQAYLTGAQGDLDREDRQAARKEERDRETLARAEREQLARDAQMAQLQERLRSEGLSREERERHNRQMEMIIAQNNAATQGLRAQGLEIQRTQAGNKADAAKEKADQKAREAGLSEAGLGDAILALKGASDKGTGWLAGLAQQAPGGGSLVNKYRDKSTNDAIQMVTYWTDEIRHGRFGSALTATEKASAAQYLPSEYDDLKQIQEKAQGLHNLLQKNARRLKGSESMPKELGGTETGTLTTPSSGKVGGAATAAPTVVRTGKDAKGRRVEELSDGTVRYAAGS